MQLFLKYAVFDKITSLKLYCMKKILFLFTTTIALIFNISCNKEDNYLKSSLIGIWSENTSILDREELYFRDSDTLNYIIRSNLKAVYLKTYIYRLDGNKLYLYPVDKQSESIYCKFNFNTDKSKLYVNGLWKNEPDETIEFLRQ